MATGSWALYEWSGDNCLSFNFLTQTLMSTVLLRYVIFISFFLPFCYCGRITWFALVKHYYNVVQSCRNEKPLQNHAKNVIPELGARMSGQQESGSTTHTLLRRLVRLKQPQLI
jgi:hypothetical protein